MSTYNAFSGSVAGLGFSGSMAGFSGRVVGFSGRVAGFSGRVVGLRYASSARWRSSWAALESSVAMSEIANETLGNGGRLDEPIKQKRVGVCDVRGKTSGFQLLCCDGQAQEQPRANGFIIQGFRGRVR